MGKIAFTLGIKCEKQAQFSAQIHEAEHTMCKVKVVPF